MFLQMKDKSEIRTMGVRDTDKYVAFSSIPLGERVGENNVA